MDEEKKDGSINPKEASLPNSIKEGQTGQAGEEKRKKVVITRQDLAKTLRKLKGRPGLQGKVDEMKKEKRIRREREETEQEPLMVDEKPPKPFVPPPDEEKLSPEEELQKALQKIQASERNPVVAEALTITLKLIFYHGFSIKRATGLKKKDARMLPQDLQSDVRDYIRHLQASGASLDDDLFPCYRGRGEKRLQWFLVRHQCPGPESLRELGVKHNYDTLFRIGIEDSEALIKTAKKFRLREKQVKRILGWVDAPRVRKKDKNEEWSISDFLKKLKSKEGTAEVKVAERILQWAKDKGLSIKMGSGSNDGSFALVLDYKRKLGKNKEPYRSISVWTYGDVEIQFKMMSKKPPFHEVSKRLELLQKFNQIPGISIPENAIGQRPKIPLSDLTGGDILNQFLSVVDWVIGQEKQHFAEEQAALSQKMQNDRRLPARHTE